MYRKQPQHNSLAVAVIAGLISMASLPAFAQDAAGAPKKDEAVTLDKLVVTAQKREEAMQDVPIMVTSLSNQALQDGGVRDIKGYNNTLLDRFGVELHVESKVHYIAILNDISFALSA